MPKTVISKSEEILVIIQTPEDFPEKTDDIARKLRQILVGLSKAVEETGDRKIVHQGMEILEKNLSRSANEILEIVNAGQKRQQE